MNLADSPSWDALERATRWLAEPSDHATVMSSRVRAARNLEGVSFPHRMDAGEAGGALDRVLGAAPPGLVARMGDLTEIRRDFLVERRLISFELAETDIPKAVVVLPDERVSIMVNEEDHLRIQGVRPGFRIAEAWEAVRDCEAVLGRRLDFAFSEDLGYLTACPTNVGTGLRVSALLHLPGLVAAGRVGAAVSAVEAVGMMVRGFYGEGTEPSGDVFQFSTERTLGKSEDRILSEAASVIQSIAEEEERARASLGRDGAAAARVRERIARAAEAEAVTSDEALSVLSLFMLARALGIMGTDDRRTRGLFFELLPAHMQVRRGRLMTPRERDVERAAVLREMARSFHV